MYCSVSMMLLRCSLYCFISFSSETNSVQNSTTKPLLFWHFLHHRFKLQSRCFAVFNLSWATIMSEQSNGDTELTPMKKTQRPPMNPAFFPIPWHILDEPSPYPTRMKAKTCKKVVDEDPVTPQTPQRSKDNDELQLQSSVDCPATPLPSRKHGSAAITDVTPPGAPNKSRRLSSTMPDGTPIKDIDDDDDSSVSSPGLLPTRADIPDDHVPSDDAIANAPLGYVLEWDFLFPNQREWVMRHQPGGSLSDTNANVPPSGGGDDDSGDADSEGDNSISDIDECLRTSSSSGDEPVLEMPRPSPSP